MSKKIAVVGATGAVGHEILKILEARKFPVGELVPFASARSVGKSVVFKGKSFPCQVMRPGCFNGVDIAFFDASDAVSQEWVPHAAESGAWVIDNSATFRLDPDVLLLVPEVNGEYLHKRLKNGVKNQRDRILTGPNCSTVQLVMALKPLHHRYGLKRVVVSTYQSTSGGGKLAMEELLTQAGDYLAGRPGKAEIFPHQIAFNCIPQVGGFKGSDGSTSEEQKMLDESRKILGIPDLRMSLTAVRVPTLGCHSESVNVEFLKEYDLAELRAELAAFPGVKILDDITRGIYPLGETFDGDLVEGGRGRDSVYVGRIRRDPSVESGLNLWVVSDNLRKGAALNAVQIGECLLK